MQSASICLLENIRRKYIDMKLKILNALLALFICLFFILRFQNFNQIYLSIISILIVLLIVIRKHILSEKFKFKILNFLLVIIIIDSLFTIYNILTA